MTVLDAFDPCSAYEYAAADAGGLFSHEGLTFSRGHAGGRLPSSFFISNMSHGQKVGMAGAAGGGLAYAMCKRNCPGAPKGLLANLPGAGVVKGAGKMLGGLGGMLGFGQGNDDESNENAHMDEDAENSPEPVDQKTLEFEKCEGSACRLNCKIQSLMAAAAAAGATGLALNKTSAMPLDEQLAAPALALMRQVPAAGSQQNGGSAGSGANASVRQRKAALYLEADCQETPPAAQTALAKEPASRFLDGAEDKRLLSEEASLYYGLWSSWDSDSASEDEDEAPSWFQSRCSKQRCKDDLPRDEDDGSASTTDEE